MEQDQHHHDGRLGNIHRVYLDALQMQRQYERPVDDGHQHLQDHQPYGDGHITFGRLCQLGQEGRARRSGNDDQADCRARIHRDHQLS